MTVLENAPAAAAPTGPSPGPDTGVLGALSIESLFGADAIGAPKHRQVLALLLLESNQVVGTDTMVTELWGRRPPASWATTLQTYVYQLRRRALPDAPGRIVTHRRGYRLELDPARLDVAEFEERYRRARDLDGSDPHTAATAYERSLQLWRGVALADVERGPVTDAAAARLDGMRRAAQQRRIEALYRGGHLTDVIAETRALVVRQPLDEALHTLLVRALARRGRRQEALDRARHFHEHLRVQLGVPSSPTMHRIYQEVLEGR